MTGGHLSDDIRNTEASPPEVRLDNKESEVVEPANSEPPDEGIPDGVGFYWRQTRENLLTNAGIRMFELAYAHKDEEFETARRVIDAEYERLSPRHQRSGAGTQRHGGSFINHIALLQELGLMYTSKEGPVTYLRTTPAGEQAAVMLKSLPGPLRVIPYFLIELLARYQLNNPLNLVRKNATLAEEFASSDVFPYWSLYKIMRSVGDRLTKDELARFVFKTKRMDDIPSVTAQILAYRRDIASGHSKDQLDKTYGLALSGAIAQPKYIMGRAGYQSGVITLADDTYELAGEYISFIDAVLASKPEFEELDESTWIRRYGDPVEATEEIYLPFDEDAALTPLSAEIDDNDRVLLEVKQLFDDGYAGVILAGPPGTGKTWYARQIAIKLTDGVGSRMREIQFHPSYQYEDFVEGYVPDGQGGFALTNRHLLTMCIRAAQSTEPFVLIIDELSRTDPARVMGEMLTYMETSLRGQTFFLPSGRRASVPKNLMFLGTMNPEDRSVDDIDAAMDRRWARVYLEPDAAVLGQFLTVNGIAGPQRGAIIEFFKAVQENYPIGHAFFRNVRDLDSLLRLWNNQLRFVVEKAFKHDTETKRRIQVSWDKMIGQLSALPGFHNPPAGPPSR